VSRGNVEIVRRIYEAAARRDSEAAMPLYDEDVEWDISHAPARELIAGSHLYHGHDGLQRFFREWHEAWESVEADYEELIDAGENVVVIETTRGRGRKSGVEVELPHASVWSLREGKVVRVVWFGTRAEALAAAGGV
jgi:ketosteroid isomerase-like protein